jgi:uncharacterized small protein (DUF1192 family)
MSKDERLELLKGLREDCAKHSWHYVWSDAELAEMDVNEIDELISEVDTDLERLKHLQDLREGTVR